MHKNIIICLIQYSIHILIFNISIKRNGKSLKILILKSDFLPAQNNHIFVQIIHYTMFNIPGRICLQHGIGESWVLCVTIKRNYSLVVLSKLGEGSTICLSCGYLVTWKTTIAISMYGEKHLYIQPFISIYYTAFFYLVTHWGHLPHALAYMLHLKKDKETWSIKNIWRHFLKCCK